MSVVRFGTVGVAAGLALAALLGASGTAAAADGTARISDVKTRDGVVQYLFSARDLGEGQRLDPNSVVVESAGRTLTATAATPDGSTATGPVQTPLREVILTLDVSGSMQGDGITAARNAAVAYARSLPADVRIGVVTFSDRPRVLLNPIADRAKVTGTIKQVQAAGNTALYDALITAASVMNGLPANAQKRLVVLSDGADTASTHTLAQATATLAANNVAADVVAFRLPGDRAVLNTIASTSHGTVLNASDAGTLARAFAAAAKQFDQQVLVTVQVPDDLANTQATLVTSLNTGAASISASVDVMLPNGVNGAVDTTTLVTSAPAGSSSKTLLWLVCGVAFVSLLILSTMFLWMPIEQREKARQNARLAEVGRYQLLGAAAQRSPSVSDAPAESQLTRRALAFVDRSVRAGGKRERIVDELERAGMRMRPEEWVVFEIAVVAATGALLAVLFGSILGVVVGAPIGWAGCRFFINTKITRRANAFIDQMPDTLQLIAGSLRSGFSLNQALVGVVREGSEPTASEFSRALTEVRLGSDLDDALDGVALRMKCPDLHWVVMAIRISREVGGNLAEVLQNTVGTMRERAQLRGQVRVLSAEGRISAKILIALPFLMAAYLLTFKHGYLSPLIHTGAGIAMLCTGVVLLITGAFWITRLVKIEV